VTLGTDPLDYDSDDDGFGDGDEVTEQSDPNDAGSLPLRSVSQPQSVLNQAAPPRVQGRVSVKNQAAPEAVQGRSEGRALTVENQ
tara:strand:- start:2578 stop:2832 length:255 start_codon:yes stop_codon:yes gene_type:complete